MKNFYRHFEGLFLTLFIILLLFSSSQTSHIQTAGISDTLKEINQTIDGIASFIKTIYTITSAVGFTTIVFFLAVLIFSAGLASLGIPRGAPSLLISLILIDGIWIIWNMSMASKEIISQKMIYTNGIITAPLILYYLIKYLIPALINKIKDKRIKINDDPGEILNRLTILNNAAQNSLIEDNESKISLKSKVALLKLKDYIDSLEQSSSKTSDPSD